MGVAGSATVSAASFEFLPSPRHYFTAILTVVLGLGLRVCSGAADGASPVSTESFIIHGMHRVVHASCPHDCPDACGVLITIEDGRATKIQGDPEHPVTRGFLCAKVAKYLDRVYSPERVLYPMRRVRPKGPTADAGYADKSVHAADERSFAPHGRPGAAVPTQAV